MSDAGPRGRQVADAALYAVGIVAACTAVGALLSFPLGGDWPGVKFALFALGLLLFGIGTLELRPTPAWRDRPRFSIEPDGETPFQAAVQGLLPPRLRLAPDRRLPVGARLLLGGALALLVSFLMEAVLGVGVPAR